MIYIFFLAVNRNIALNSNAQCNPDARSLQHDISDLYLQQFQWRLAHHSGDLITEIKTIGKGQE